MSKDARRTTVYLYPDDDAAIALLKKRLGLTSDAAAIRYALRVAAQQQGKKEQSS